MLIHVITYRFTKGAVPIQDYDSLRIIVDLYVSLSIRKMLKHGIVN